MGQSAEPQQAAAPAVAAAETAAAASAAVGEQQQTQPPSPRPQPPVLLDGAAKAQCEEKEEVNEASITVPVVTESKTSTVMADGEPRGTRFSVQFEQEEPPAKVSGSSPGKVSVESGSSRHGSPFGTFRTISTTSSSCRGSAMSDKSRNSTLSRFTNTRVIFTSSTIERCSTMTFLYFIGLVLFFCAGPLVIIGPPMTYLAVFALFGPLLCGLSASCWFCRSWWVEADEDSTAGDPSTTPHATPSAARSSTDSTVSNRFGDASTTLDAGRGSEDVGDAQKFGGDGGIRGSVVRLASEPTDVHEAAARETEASLNPTTPASKDSPSRVVSTTTVGTSLTVSARRGRERSCAWVSLMSSVFSCIFIAVGIVVFVAEYPLWEKYP
mmetsp:Transcript_65640/g.165397  ORF Transcript_65640/g.165397 Transcript_65640/m.165397 type:complete len:382 (+) Transcript_65640:70-1215(+)|eukprot:CAMPEP_0115436670 /NCGR_PEP_ID=MMETSP0271-20121206/34329_1 /TAXON_ID=71861 /ORGANISM="Scrippsiella trochoidea, Strain CCMP3099" /LENGTH=381 /DNA_ID=CAMNT_0002862235 /DNA_START=109 /DNA_END=1254 /DNA_ORIENTATION=+